MAGGWLERLGGRRRVGYWLAAALVVAAALVESGVTTPQRAETGQPSAAGVARAQSAGEAPFDYYVLALSWSPSFCIDRPDADQCALDRRFVLHGLWPQYENGYPSDCDTRAPGPGRRDLDAAAGRTDAEAGLLAYQWRKHGSCSGLSGAEYLEASVAAFEAITIPNVLLSVGRDFDVDPRVVEAAFVEANPGFDRDGIAVRCRDDRLQEVRFCLTPELEPRACGADAGRDCRARAIDVPAPR